MENTSNNLGSFDNLIILKEFSNIANLVSNEEFLELVPKTNFRRMKWIQLLNCLKQGIYDGLVQEMCEMWTHENMIEKLEALEKQRDKYEGGQPAWRPEVGDVKTQTKAAYVANLLKQKRLLENVAKRYDSRVNSLKMTITGKRGYLKILQSDIKKYNNKVEDMITKMGEKMEAHGASLDIALPETEYVDEDKAWTDDMTGL